MPHSARGHSPQETQLESASPTQLKLARAIERNESTSKGNPVVSYVCAWHLELGIAHTLTSADDARVQ